MPKSFLRNLFTRSIRSRKTSPILKHQGPVGRRIEELEDRALPYALVGVDFGAAGDPAPPNWNHGVGTNVSLTNLIDETGVPTVFDLTMTPIAGGGNGPPFTPAAGQLPTHTNPLANINEIVGNNDGMSLVFSDLTAGAAYEVYVFGAKPFALPGPVTQAVTITGGGATLNFNQSFTLVGDELWVNGQQGSNAALSSFAVTQTANGSGQITVVVSDPAGGSPYPVGLAAIAIRPVSASPPVTRVYVAERNPSTNIGGRVEVFDETLALVQTIDHPIFDNGIVQDVEIGPTGDVFVGLDTTPSGLGTGGQIARFTQAGAFVSVVNLPNDANGGFYYPLGFDVAADGTFWVATANTPNTAIHVSATGALLGVFNGPAAAPVDVAVGAAGQLFISDGISSSEFGINARADGNLWIAKPATGTVILRTPGGTVLASRTFGPSTADAEEAVDGSLYVARFAASGSLRKYDAAGTVVQTVNTAESAIFLAVAQVAPPVGTVSGTKFNDLDGDGAFDGGEPGLPGWTIYADLNNNNALDGGEPSTVTGTGGNYSLALPPGSYTIREVEQSGWVQTAPGVSRLFSANPGTGLIYELNTTSGAVLNSFAAPISFPGAVGLAFNGVTLFFLSAADNRLYELNPTTGAVLDSTLLPARPYDGLAALNDRVFAMDSVNSDIVIFDAATNSVLGVLDVNAVNPGLSIGGGISGVANPNALLAATNTDTIVELDPVTGVVTGSFNNLSGGNFDAGLAYVNGEIYVGLATGGIAVFSRAGAFIRAFAAGSGQVLALGGDPGIGVHSVTLSAGQTLTGKDFGNKAVSGTVSGVKFNDLDGDGVQDGGEPGLSGWTIYADVNNNNALDGGEPSTVTGPGGTYTLTLAAGSYTIREVQQSGWMQTAPQSSRLFSVQSTGPIPTIFELNPTTGAVLNSFPAPAPTVIFGPQGLALGPTSLFYIDGSNNGTHTLYELNPTTGAIIDSDVLPGTAEIAGAGFLNGRVYLEVHQSDQILVFDPVSDTVVTTLTVPADLIGALTGAQELGLLYDANFAGQIFAIDPANGAVVNTLNPGVGGFGGGLAYVSGELRASAFNTTTIYRINPTNGAVLGTITTGGAGGISALGGDGGTGAHNVSVAAGGSLTGRDFGNQAVGGLTASFDGSNNLVISDTAGQVNNLTLSGDGTSITITDATQQFAAPPAIGTLSNGNRTLTVLLSSIPGDKIIVNTGAANDSLTVNLATAIGKIVDFDGGTQTSTPGDSLTVTGGSFATVTHKLINANDGQVTAGTNVINYSGLEPVNDNTSATNRIFDFTGASETITLSDTGGADNKMTITSTLAESVNFTNPTASLQIITTNGTGPDTVTISSVDAAYNAAFTISSTTGDSANLNATMNLGSGNLSVTSGTISLTAAIASTGNASLHALGGAIAESGAGSIGANNLTTSSATGTTLNGANTVGTFNATNSTSGNVAFSNTAATLNITGISETGGGSVTVTNSGDINITGAIAAASGGAVNLTSNAGKIAESGTGTVATTGLLTTNSATGTYLGTALPQPGSLVGYYPLVANSNDASGNGNNLAASAPPPSLVAGTGFQFTAANNNFFTAPINVNYLVQNQVTFGGWFNSSALGAAGSIRGLISADAGAFDRTIDIDNRGGGGWAWSAFTGAGVLGGPAVVANTWTFVTVRYDYNTVTGQQQTTLDVLPLGGSLTELTTTVTPGHLATASNLTIGRNPLFDLPFDGLISGAFVYSTALTNAQLNAIATLGPSIPGGGGTNQVASFNATNSTSGGIGLTNTASTLTVTGVSQSGGGGVTVTNTGSLSLTGTLAAAERPVSLTASGSISESGSGKVSSTGTLTTSSATGQTLNGSNTVGTFNATNSTSGNVAFTNTAASLNITGISETGGTTTVGNTGSTTISGTGITSTGNVQVNTSQNLTVSSAVASSGGSSALGFGSGGGGNLALINANITGTSASVTGGTGVNTITVNNSGATTLTLNGAGAGDIYNVNFGSLGGTVAISDAGPGGTDKAFINGTAAADTFEVNTTAASTVQFNSTVQKVTYSAANLEQMTLDGAAAADLYNVQFANGPLPATFTIADSGASGTTDTAKLFGTTLADTFNINTAAPDTVRYGSPVVTETVNYNGNLEQLTISGPAFPGDPTPTTPTATDVGDLFIATPDAQTLITIHGGNPTAGAGDTLQLTAIGLLSPVITPSPARPNGQLASSNRQTLNWTSIESLPVPIGLGGTFDFGAPTSSVQGGFIGIAPSDTPSSGQFPANIPLSFPGVGWVNSGAGTFDRPAVYGADGIANSPQLKALLQDGEWGYAGGVNGVGSGNGVFQVAVAPGQNVAVTAFIGDTFGPRDRTNVYVSDSGAPGTYTKLNTSLATFDTTGGTHQYVSYTGMFTPTTNTLFVTIEETHGGTSGFWTISGLDVRPQGLIAPLTVARADLALPSVAMVADGLTTDAYTGSGGPPFAELTINQQYGTNVGVDADPAVKGFQVVASATGTFAFSLLRPTGSGPSLITVTDVTGESGTGNLGQTGTGSLAATPNPFTLPSQFSQTYVLPAVRRIDFGTPTSPVVAAPYIGWSNQAWVSTASNALGWTAGTPLGFDRGASFSTLQRDGVYGSAAGDYRVDLAVGTYSVTAVLGDMINAQAGMNVQWFDSGTSMWVMAASGISTPAGQARSVTFNATTDGTGALKLRFGTDQTNANALWTLQSLEVRPVAGSATPGAQAGLSISNVGGSAGPYANATLAITGTVPADGAAVTYTVTGAVANSFLTITTSLGSVASSDVGPTFTQIQVQANGVGTATFSLNAPLSTTALAGTIAVTDVTGASLGVFTQNYAGANPPLSPPGQSVQRFDFNSGSPTLAGFYGVQPSDLYSTTAGFGWKTGVYGYDRGNNSGGNPTDLFRDGAWDTGPGVFRIGVTPSDKRDVRLYYGDPFRPWREVSVQVEGNATVLAIDPELDRYGFVTLTGSDALADGGNNDGVLDITIMGGVWVASGIDSATPGNLPVPATPAVPTPASRRLEFATTPIGGFTSALGTYSAANGFGWTMPVNSFVRPASMFPPTPVLTATQQQFYGSGAWSQGTSTFAIAVPLNPSATYSIHAYVSDPYNAWSGITVSGENAVSPPPVTAGSGPATAVTLSNLKDLNGDGLVTFTITGPVWVLNGLDFTTGAPGGLPAAP